MCVFVITLDLASVSVRYGIPQMKCRKSSNFILKISTVRNKIFKPSRRTKNNTIDDGTEWKSRKCLAQYTMKQWDDEDEINLMIRQKGIYGINSQEIPIVNEYLTPYDVLRCQRIGVQ